MPDQRRHRGKHPKDPELFADSVLPTLTQAVDDYCMLLSRDYASKAALKLVGDHFMLAARQRKAVERVSAPESAAKTRKAKCLSPNDIEGEHLHLDGYNQLITTESLLSKAFVFRCRDGSYRDIASIHGTYRKVEETCSAIDLIGAALETLAIKQVTWLIDAPISNSGRLRSMLLDIAEQREWPWQVELDNNPDKILASVPGTVITSDSWILDQCQSWFNLTEYLIKNRCEFSDSVIKL